jgi:uncharacterized protein YeeX (DUF496 family)
MAKGKKTGGRIAGTPNKATQLGKDTIMALLTSYRDSGMMDKDFAGIKDPRDRLMIAERLMQYIMPRMQSTSVDITADAKKTIEDRLQELSGDGE